MADLRIRPERATAGLVKLAFNFRLFALVLTLAWLPFREGVGLPAGLALVLTAAALTSAVPIFTWDRIGETVVHHPLFLLADLLLAGGILTLTSPDSPFYFFVIGTALLAGALYAWSGALVLSAVLLTAYYWSLYAEGVDLAGLGFQGLVGLPALLPIAAVAGAALRALLVAQARTGRRLAESVVHAATAEERGRIAREMHDSLAKTLQGMALGAAALPDLYRHDPDAAERAATDLAAATQTAADEAREIIAGMRADDLERPLHETVRGVVTSWAASADVSASCDLADCGDVPPPVRYELMCILREALRNVATHARADEVVVTLRPAGDTLRLAIRDDGDGFEAPGDLATLAEEGHYGVVGMAERAAAVGGECTVVSDDGAGTTVTAHLPVTVAKAPQPADVVRPEYGTVTGGVT